MSFPARAEGLLNMVKCQSERRNNGNERVFLTLQNSRTRASPSNTLLSYTGKSLVAVLIFFLYRCSQCILQPQPTRWSIRKCILSFVNYIQMGKGQNADWIQCYFMGLYEDVKRIFVKILTPGNCTSSFFFPFCVNTFMKNTDFVTCFLFRSWTFISIFV